jgi:hypothetical protein
MISEGRIDLEQGEAEPLKGRQKQGPGARKMLNCPCLGWSTN